tara:strand:+ start:136 stop:1038 length:903 start_codon:yes stop_codon:yes gene_type:complete
MTLYYLIITIVVYFLYYFYIKNIDYYGLIVKNSKIPDYTRWILSDKYVSKEYAKLFGFKASKTYELVKYPYELTFTNDSYVIKPVDLCDSAGVFIIKNGYDLSSGEKVNSDKIVNNLLHLRSSIFNEYYMHEYMFNGIVPYSGYIKEELLLDNNNVPNDYKCYVFGGKLYYIAVTFNRKMVNNKQQFNSVWFDRNWEPVKFKMIKQGYKYKKISRPKSFDKLIYLVENMGKKLKRHCRIDVYIIDNEIYLGEFTFFCGASLHTLYSNYCLGIAWLKNPDDYYYQDCIIKKLVPKYYNSPF